DSGTVALQYLSLDSPEIRRLADEIRELKQTFLRNSSDMVAEVGERLQQAKGALTHGDWLIWLSDQACFSSRTAQRYMNVAAFAHQHAELFVDLKDLGPAKLYGLAVLDQPLLNQLLGSEYLVVPGTQREKTLAELSVVEFYQVIRALQGTPAFDPQKAVLRLGRRLRRINQDVETLALFVDELNPADVQMLAEQLESLLQRLREPRSLEAPYDEDIPPEPGAVPAVPEEPAPFPMDEPPGAGYVGAAPDMGAYENGTGSARTEPRSTLGI
ncbi:MAG: DUF3102 domain-containing protein, partial [Lentisphaerae bacterium]|nr:DUF3102 domain-containing protein [Lentisphaerota bacterium]